ncbi:hypothetical protein PFISCL1PPCAC_5665 [Pristionchus fissidentatus]|uniref:Transmembrane protein 151B n=1 Tax=Pristionchus fissidentatus TaxID=1538716 RepID=A0AAV5V812_9BILA|nr:hypothetical protein PFISCL1PPCAC_5665 [Pristionchus fissidentatus]
MTHIDSIRLPKARRISLLRALHRSFSFKSSCCSTLIILCLLYFAHCHFTYNAYSADPSTLFSHGPCSQGYNLLPVLFSLILYAIYLSECWQSRSKLGMLKELRLSDTGEYLKELRASTPHVWWKAVSYHYARRTRQITRYRNGEALSASQVYYERVDSVTAEEYFLYDSCGVRDISGEAESLDSFSATRIYISRGFAFATVNAAREFEEQRARFFDDYEQRDDYLEVREGMNLSQPVQHILCYKGSKPWFLRPTLFWTLSILLLSWPIRALSEWRTAYLHYRVIKLFGTNYLSPSSVNYTGPLSRCSSMDSIALRSAVFSAPLLLPSYSMALLTPTIPTQLADPSPPHRYYGGMDVPPPILVPPPRSTSFNEGFTPSRHLMRPARSRSYGWISPWGTIDEEGERLIPSESPPPYEIAIRLCAPLYNRIRSSLSRLHSSSSLRSLPKTLSRVEEA